MFQKPLPKLTSTHLPLLIIFAVAWTPILGAGMGNLAFLAMVKSIAKNPAPVADGIKRVDGNSLATLWKSQTSSQEPCALPR
jgi:hypothetical protein